MTEPLSYPKFNALVYAFEVFVPLLNLHQAQYWLPNAKRGAWGSVLRVYFWFHRIVGTVLSTLLVGALTGLIRPA